MFVGRGQLNPPLTRPYLHTPHPHAPYSSARNHMTRRTKMWAPIITTLFLVLGGAYARKLSHIHIPSSCPSEAGASTTFEFPVSLRLDHGALLHLDEIVLGEQKRALVHGTELELDIASTLKTCNVSKETMEFSLEVLAASCATFAGMEARLDCGKAGLSTALKSAEASFVQSFSGHVERDSIPLSFLTPTACRVSRSSWLKGSW